MNGIEAIDVIMFGMLSFSLVLGLLALFSDPLNDIKK